ETTPAGLPPPWPPGMGRFVPFAGTETPKPAGAHGLSVATKSGAEFRSFMLLEVLAMSSVTAVRLDTTPLAAVENLTQLDSESAGWTASPGGSLFIKVPPGEHEVEIELGVGSRATVRR